MYSLELVTNQKSAKHEKKINDCFSDAEEIILCSAYWKEEGIKKIEKNLKDAIKKGIKVTIYASLNEEITTPDALDSLYEMVKGKEASELYLCDKSHGIFHPKIYYFRKGSQFTVIIGSANLTKGGLSHNNEASIMLKHQSDTEFHSDLKKYFDSFEEIFKSKLDKLQAYRDRYYKKHRRKKNKKADTP